MFLLTFLGFLYFFAGSTSQSGESCLGDQLDDGAVSAEVRDLIAHVTNILLISFGKYSNCDYLYFLSFTYNYWSGCATTTHLYIAH